MHYLNLIYQWWTDLILILNYPFIHKYDVSWFEDNYEVWLMNNDEVKYILNKTCCDNFLNNKL